MNQKNTIDTLYYNIEEELEKIAEYLKISKKLFNNELCQKIDNITEDSIPDGFKKADFELNEIGVWESSVLSYFSQSFILLSFRILEKCLSDICNLVKEQKNIKIKRNDLRYSVLESSKKYLETFGGFKIPPNVFRNMKTLQSLRNFLIHGNSFEFDMDDTYQMKATNENEKNLKSLIDKHCGVEDIFGNVRIKVEFCDYCLQKIKSFIEVLHEEHLNNFQIRSANINSQ